MHLICRNGFVLSFWVLQLNGAADKRCQCVFAHLAALLTHWVFQKAFIQGETPHGSNSLCKQNLKQNHPPVNSRQPCTHTYSAQTHFLCPPPPTVHHKNGTFLRKNTQMPGALWCRHTTGLDVVNRLLSCWDSETNYESECASLMERRVEETQAVLTGELELSDFIRKTYPHCDFFLCLFKERELILILIFGRYCRCCSRSCQDNNFQNFIIISLFSVWERFGWKLLIQILSTTQTVVCMWRQDAIPTRTGKEMYVRILW